MKICSNCNAQAPDHIKYCENCGSPFLGATGPLPGEGVAGDPGVAKTRPPNSGDYLQAPPPAPPPTHSPAGPPKAGSADPVNAATRRPTAEEYQRCNGAAGAPPPGAKTRPPREGEYGQPGAPASGAKTRPPTEDEHLYPTAGPKNRPDRTRPPDDYELVDSGGAGPRGARGGVGARPAPPRGGARTEIHEDTTERLVGWLVVVDSVDEQRYASYPLRDRINIIGRKGGSQRRGVLITERGISDLHAVLFHADGKYRLLDMDSSNGTWLGKKKLTPLEPLDIEDNDVIRVGRTSLAFRAFTHVSEQPGA